MTIEEILNRITLDTWILSDTHLAHKNILDFEGSRLAPMIKAGYTAEEHDQWIVDTWNKTVKPGETVLHLGDFAFKGVADYIDQLNGNIILVLGNHDDKPTKAKFDGLDVVDGFYWSQGELINKVQHPDPMFSGFIKEFNGKKYLFAHYPVFDTDDWDRKNKMIAPRIKVLETIYKANDCEGNVHGHTHSNESAFEDSFNVSFEHTDFKPKRLGDIIC